MSSNVVRVMALFAPLLLLGAAQPWSRDSKHWTADDVQRILLDSPWSQPASATFPAGEAEPSGPPIPLPGAAEAGLPGNRAATDGHWDGGVGRMNRGGVPTLTVTVRWDSALPVRQALAQEALTSHSAALGPALDEAPTHYIVTVIGLIPAGGYRRAGKLATDSESGDRVDARDPEQLLEGLMSLSILVPHGRPEIRPSDVKLDPATGEIHVFFPRAVAIKRQDKEVTFATRFGSLTVEKRFALKEMMYGGKLEL